MGAGREKKESRETSNQGFKQGRVISQRATKGRGSRSRGKELLVRKRRQSLATLEYFPAQFGTDFDSLFPHKYSRIENNLITSLVHFKQILIHETANWKTSYQFIALLLITQQGCPLQQEHARPRWERLLGHPPPRHTVHIHKQGLTSYSSGSLQNLII